MNPGDCVRRILSAEHLSRRATPFEMVLDDKTVWQKISRIDTAGMMLETSVSESVC